MLIVYENTFESFLSAVFDIYALKLTPTFFTAQSDGFLDSVVDGGKTLVYEQNKYNRVKNGLIKKNGREEFRRISTAWLNCRAGKEKTIYEYIRLLFDNSSFKERLDLAAVVNFNDLVSQVEIESHRMLGFIRFIETAQGFYYAAISPDNDVLSRVTPHFVNRFGIQKFVIHDYKRNKAAVYNGTKAEFLSLNGGVTIELSGQEALIQALFKQYFNDIAIKERTNKRLQNAFMPKRYRINMPETFKDESQLEKQLDFKSSCDNKRLN